MLEGFSGLLLALEKGVVDTLDRLAGIAVDLVDSRPGCT